LGFDNRFVFRIEEVVLKVVLARLINGTQVLQDVAAPTAIGIAVIKPGSSRWKPTVNGFIQGERFADVPQSILARQFSFLIPSRQHGRWKNGRHE
jgi:hypothetical protein